MKQVKGVIDNEKVVIKIEQDDTPESPREWDNLGTMICWHNRYDLGDKHSYSEPRDFLESLASDFLDTELGKQLIEAKVNEKFDDVILKVSDSEFLVVAKELEDYEIFQNLDGEHVLFSKESLEEIKQEEYATLDEAKERAYEKKTDLISDEYTGPRHMHYVQRTILGEKVMDEIRAKVNKTFAYVIFKKDDSYYLIDQKKNKPYFAIETFETQEEAQNYLDEEKEEWMDGDVLEDLSSDELLELIQLEHIILPLYLYDHSGITMNTSGFSCSWDSGQVGWIYASKDTFRKETGYQEDELFNIDKHRAPVVGEGAKLKGHEEKSYDGFGKITKIEDGIATVDFDYNKVLSARKEENVVTVPLSDVLEVRNNRAKEMLEGEVETYDQYLTGDVYGFVLEKVVEADEDGEEETEEMDSCWGFYGDDPFENGMSDHFEKKYHELLKKLA